MATTDARVVAADEVTTSVGRKTWWFLGAVALGTLIYSLTVKSLWSCVGGYGANGGYVDASGNVTDTEPSCLGLTMRPSGLVYFAIAAITVVALVLAYVVRHNASRVHRVLERATVAVALVAIGSFAIAHLWFGQIGVDAWDGTAGSTPRVPVIVAHVEVNVVPLTRDAG